MLDGVGASLTSDSVTVGALGTGSLQVTDKATLFTSAYATVASKNTEVQQGASVGAQGLWSIVGALDIGKSGTGQMIVDGGGTVAAATVDVGSSTLSVGSLAVSGGSGGVASTVDYGMLLAVGKSGSGTLTIAQGATVEAGTTHTGTVEIGANASSDGGITLSDAGSVLATALLTVGGGKTAAGGAGTLAIGTGAVVAADTVTVWSSGVVALSGGTLDPDPVSNAGSIGGFGTVEGAVGNTGTIAAHDGTLVLTGAVNGAGSLAVQTGATLELQQAVAATQAIGFAGGALVLDDLAAEQGTLENFAAGDRIVLNDVVADGGSFSGGVLTLTEGDTTISTLALAGSYGPDDFLVQNSAGTTEVMIPCFAAGTRIATRAARCRSKRCARATWCDARRRPRRRALDRPSPRRLRAPSPAAGRHAGARARRTPSAPASRRATCCSRRTTRCSSTAC